MIKINNLFFSYAKEYYTLHDINFNLKKGDGAIIVGDKNSGKTSLIRVLLGLDKFNSGSVLINNIPIGKINYKEDLSLGYIPNEPPFIKNKSVEYNLKYVIRLREKNKELVDVKVRNTLIEYNLYSIKNVKVEHLNYYDKLILAIARLSIRNLDLLIVDDIFIGLSDKEMKDVVSILKQLIKSNMCSVLITTSDENVVSDFRYKKYYLQSGSLSLKKGEIDDWFKRN